MGTVMKEMCKSISDCPLVCSSDSQEQRNVFVLPRGSSQVKATDTSVVEKNKHYIINTYINTDCTENSPVDQ